MKKIIEVSNLSYSYHDGTKALDNITFSVEENECIGIVGPNGSGKSTLLLHLNGILPDDGRGSEAVKIFDKPIRESSIEEIRRDVGVIFQDPEDQLFCPTVFEDVAFGPRQFGLKEDEIQNTVRDALKMVDMEFSGARSPHHLSGGEKQRVCLAGILACQPKILVLDEPTSKLDPRGRRSLKEFLKSVPATKIIATHDLELVVELCQRTILLDHGKLIGSGKTIDLLNDEKLMVDHGLERPHILRHQHPH